MGGVSEDQVGIFIGAQLRRFRKLAGMSQTDLARHIGVSFQQLQKYERGINRIAAAQLYILARALKRPIADFLPEAKDCGAAPASPLGRLARAFAGIASGKTRLATIALLEAVAEQETTTSD